MAKITLDLAEECFESAPHFIAGPESELARFRKFAIGTEKNERTGEEFELLDFNKIVPCPPILLETSESSVSENAANLIIMRAERGAPFATAGMSPIQIKRIRDEMGMPDAPIYKVAAAYLAKHPDEEAEGKLRLRAIIETGFASWYPWNITNWGTKWNSYRYHVLSQSEGRLEIGFETAWAFPHPIFEKLAELFPALRFEAVAFDEVWNFATKGYAQGEDYQIRDIDATDELYVEVHGRAPERDEEERFIKPTHG